MPAVPNGYYSNRSGSNKEFPFRLGSTPVSLGLFNTAKGFWINSNKIRHPEAINWVNRAQKNEESALDTYDGGQISEITLDAVSEFCYAIDAAGIRDRFMRLNLFCGNNLKACVVPLYTNTSMNYAHVGNAVDANNNFVEGDYNPGTGLTGGPPRILETGVTQFLSNSGGASVILNSHMSVYVTSANIGTGQSEIIMGATNAPAYADYYLKMSPESSIVALNGLENNSYVRSTAHSMSGNTSSTLTGLTVGTSSNSLGKIYNDNVDITQSYNPGSLTIDVPNICVFGYYDADNEELVADSDATLGGYSFGNYMTPTQVANYTSAMSAFQTAMGRAAP